MRKQLIAFLVMLGFIFSVPGVTQAINTSYTAPNIPPQDLAQAMADDNNYLGFSYFVDKLPSGQKLRMEKYTDGEYVLIYGAPRGDIKQGQYRFLGLNDKGENVTNINFPNDAAPEGMLNDQKWIIEPWKSPELKSFLNKNNEKLFENKPFDGDPAFLENIKAGLKLKLPAEYRSTPAVQWNKIVHILQPPTYFGWGVGRAWHKKADGSIWYRTIPIAPSKLVPKPQPPEPPQNPPPGNNQGSSNGNDQGLNEGGENNLKVVVTGTSSEAWPGSQVTVNAKVTNETGKLLTTDVVWKLNGKVVSTDNRFDVIAQSNTSCKFIMPSTNAKLEVTVNPYHTRPSAETTWTDNISSTTIMPEQITESQKGKITISISAPTKVEPNVAWSYMVTVKYSWTRPTGYKGLPPSQTVTLTTSGNGKMSQGIDVDGQNISPIPINRSYSKKITISGGDSQSFTFDFPGTLMINESYYVLLTANLDTGASDSAKVLVGPWPVNKPIPILYK